MDSIKTALFQKLVHDKKYDELSRMCGVIHGNSEKLVITEYAGSEPRLFKRDDEINLLCPVEMDAVMESGVARAIETGEIFDDADAVDRHADFIQKTMLPMNAIANANVEEPKKMKIVVASVIGRMNPDGRVELSGSDMDRGADVVKDIMAHHHHHGDFGGNHLGDICSKHIGCDGHMSMPLNIRKDMFSLSKEIDSIADIDDLEENELEPSDIDFDDIKTKDEGMEEQRDYSVDDDDDDEKDTDETDDEKDSDDDDETVQEGSFTPAIGNLMNQVMQIVGDAFEFFGGSFVPKFMMQSKENKDVEIDVVANGANIEVTPKYKGIPDYMKKRKGLAVSRAVNAIVEVAKEFLQEHLSQQQAKPAMATESVTIFKQPRRLKALGREIVSYIPTQIMQVQDTHDQMVLVGYVASQLEKVDFYLNCLDTDDGRYIVPHDKNYLLTLQKELTDLLQRIMKLNPIVKYDRVWKPGIR